MSIHTYVCVKFCHATFDSIWCVNIITLNLKLGNLTVKSFPLDVIWHVCTIYEKNSNHFNVYKSWKIYHKYQCFRIFIKLTNLRLLDQWVNKLKWLKQQLKIQLDRIKWNTNWQLRFKWRQLILSVDIMESIVWMAKHVWCMYLCVNMSYQDIWR